MVEREREERRERRDEGLKRSKVRILTYEYQGSTSYDTWENMPSQRKLHRAMTYPLGFVSRRPCHPCYSILLVLVLLRIRTWWWLQWPLDVLPSLPSPGPLVAVPP